MLLDKEFAFKEQHHAMGDSLFVYEGNSTTKIVNQNVEPTDVKCYKKPKSNNLINDRLYSAENTTNSTTWWQLPSRYIDEAF